jgi:nicotinate-nucleotide adenylyltransferase
MSGARRVGVFGGTFDPPHLGHLAIAERAREQLRLDLVLFVPSARPPHKRGRAVSDVQARIAMTRLAVRGHPAFRVSTLETRRAGPSYTVDTLRDLRRDLPGARFWLVLGEDGLEEFHAWHDPDGIRRLATLAVARRPPGRGGAARATGRRPRRGADAPRVVWLDAPRLEVSSRAIRARLRAGGSARYLVPDAVLRYAARNGLYRSPR